MFFIFFFFNDTATTEIYTLSLHDALPISKRMWPERPVIMYTASGNEEVAVAAMKAGLDDYVLKHPRRGARQDRKSTRLNSSHANISYAVFCLKKKKKSIILM